MTYKYRVCIFQLQVHPEGGAPYVATANRQILEWGMARIQPDSTTCGVRIDPNDPERVAIAWNVTPPGQPSAPPVTAASTTSTLPCPSKVSLASGEAGQVVIASFQATGQKHLRTGLPLNAFVLTLIPQTGDPYQTQIGLGIEAANLPRVFTGAQARAKRIAESPNDVVIDWDAAAS